MSIYNFTPYFSGLGFGATIYHIPCSNREHAVKVAESFKETWHCDFVEITQHVTQI